MQTSKQIFDKLNKGLMQRLIPLGNEPIETNFVTDCNDPIFDKSLEEVKKIIAQQEFDLELEQIKNNLKI